MPIALADFHPAVRSWFERRFDAPSRAQELGWPVIGAANTPPGFDVLLCAPTGSGKTLAAFMWAINGLVLEAERGELRDEVSVLYVSPLKALANDIRLNLEEPLNGVRDLGAESGLDLSRIRAGLRTGDTSASERAAMLRRPPHILVTTPESLFILLTSPKFREKLASVRHVIVDELHALAGNKRGAHLALTLERLERFVTSRGQARPNRIGLSATLNPIEKLAEFLAGYEVDQVATPRPVKIVRADDRVRDMDLEVIAPGPDVGPLATHQHWDAMYDTVARLIGEHRTTLVFALSRRTAERVALNLQKRLGTDAVMAHHGSLARAERLLAEQRLKRGELKAIVATASLELGIDVGAVDLVCQLDSPKSISAAIQRVGRSGHSLGATPKGRFFALTIDDLLECGAAVRAIRAGKLDEVEIPMGCLDIVAQQIVAIAAEEEEISEAELLRVLRGAYNFVDLDAAKLRHLLEQLSAELPERIMGAAPKVFFDRVNARVRPRRSARLSVITSGGTIPEAGNYDVVIESEGRKVGDVEEDFAQESSRGDVFSLGSMPWQIQRISRGRLMVEPAPGMAPTLPFWITEAGGRSQALSTGICELRHEIWKRIETNGAASAVTWLMSGCAMSERAATQAVDYVRRGVEALGAIPDATTIVVERFFDGLGGTQIVIHTPFGIRLNRGLGLAIRKRLCQSFDFEIQASAIDDGVLLALNSRHSFQLDTLFSMLKARNARDVLVQALLAAPMFEVRFRHVATRALAIMRSSRGRRVPAWIQRLRSQDLLSAIFPGQQACFENRPATIELPDHFVISETIRECLEESTDLPRTVRMLEGIESGAIRVVAVDNIAPSVFAQRLLLAWDYSFLDDGERGNRRSRTVSMNRGMAEDVFRKEDLSDLLATEAVEAVVAEVTGRAPGRRPRSPDELMELIRAHGAMTQSELEERGGDNWRAMLAELVTERRVTPLLISDEAPERIIASEDRAIFAATYPEAQIEGGSTSSEVDRDDARDEIVRRAMKTSGPTTAGEVAARLRLGASEIEMALAALESSGAIFLGHFTRADTIQWCDRYNLERIHRMTLARVRAEIEPCADHEYAAFRLRWMHIGGEELPADQTGVAAVLEQLSGVALAPELWERAMLPARIPGYRPEMLDLVCMSGQLKWVAIPGEGGVAANTPARITFVPRKANLYAEHSDDAVADPKERAVLEALGAAGAQYLDEVADRANLSERDVLGALWHLAAAGRVSNDSFAPLRMFADDRNAERALEAVGRRSPSRRDAAVR